MFIEIFVPGEVEAMIVCHLEEPGLLKTKTLRTESDPKVKCRNPGEKSDRVECHSSAEDSTSTLFQIDI